MNPSAVTRFNNDQSRAKQQMVGNTPGAASAFRRKIAGGKKSQPARELPDKVTQPTGQLPGFTPMYEPEVDPINAVAQPAPNPVDMLVKEIHVDKLVNSPEMRNANTLQKLRDHFHGKQSSPSERGAQILGILSNYSSKR